MSEVRNSHSLFNSRQISQSPIVRQLREEILHIVISNENRDFKLEEQLRTIMSSQDHIKYLERDLAQECKSNNKLKKKLVNIQLSLEKRVSEVDSERDDHKISLSLHKDILKETDDLKSDLSAKQFVIDKYKAEIKDLAAKNKLLDKTIRKVHDVSLALHKDLELSLSDVECSIEKMVNLIIYRHIVS